MNPIKNVVYHIAQLLGFFPLLYAGIKYKDVKDFDAYYDRLSKKYDWFLDSEYK